MAHRRGSTFSVVALLLGIGATGCGDGDAGTDAEAHADAAVGVPPDAASPAGDGATAGADASTPPAADATPAADAVPDGPWGGTLGAEIECAPTGSACAPLTPDTAIHASFRKDYYLDESVYPEASLDWATEAPVDGGRFHIVGIASAGGAITDVRIDGQSVADLVAGGTGIEWYHVWPDPVVAGEPVWVAFHSRSAAWDAPGVVGTLRIETDGGTALDGMFDVEPTKVPLTYVTATDDLSTLVIHARNADTVPHTLQRLLVNGRDVLAADVACVPKTEIAAGEAVMWTVPLCAEASLGNAWTVVADWADTPDAVAGGRFLRPFFPIEAWPTSSDCALPGGDDEWLAENIAAGIDTMYVYWGQGCSDYSTRDIINTHAPAMADDFNILMGDDFRAQIEAGVTGLITDYSAVAGLLTGDESDGEIYVDGAPHAENKARQARWMWRNYPEVTIYNGAKTHKNVGTFAGMTDIQGIDVYIAACAPWITGLAPPPIRASYDYLLNTRNNHMPWATWQYAQGLGNWKGQPNPAEVLVQAFSVMLAGGKGLMWFQSRKAHAADNPDTWAAMTRANRVFRAVRVHLRTGDLTGAATATGDVLVDMIRSREALVVPLVNIGSSSGPDLLTCGIAAVGGPVPHWALVAQDVDVTVDVPDDFAVVDTFEILVDDSSAQIVDIAYPADLAGRRVTYAGVPLSNATPVRILVLSASPSVRAEVAAAMAH